MLEKRAAAGECRVSDMGPHAVCRGARPAPPWNFQCSTANSVF
jgi:hypothetical protein